MKKITAFMLSYALLFGATLMAQATYSYTTPAPETYTSPSTIEWRQQYSDAISLSQTTSKPILILFTGSGWCPACMKLERDVLTRPEFAQAVAQHFVFLKAEFPDYSESAVMASPYKPLMDRYQVKVFPTFVAINSQGEQLFKVNYRQGGAQAYAQELLQKLRQQQGNSSFNSPANP